MNVGKNLAKAIDFSSLLLFFFFSPHFTSRDVIMEISLLFLFCFVLFFSEVMSRFEPAYDYSYSSITFSEREAEEVYYRVNNERKQVY